MRKIAILQSNYIPWKGYFDMIHMVDEFILYDDMQYTRRDWRNRNIIVSRQGLMWLSIPVINKGRFFQKINETKVADHKWIDNHWRSIECNYAKAKCFDEYAERIKRIYEACRKEEFLSRINYLFIKEICDILDIKTALTCFSSIKPPPVTHSPLYSPPPRGGGGKSLLVWTSGKKLYTGRIICKCGDRARMDGLFRIPGIYPIIRKI